MKGLRPRCLVVLSGGEAGARDLTSEEDFDVVEGNASGACGLQGLDYCIAAFSASYGSSDGLRRPQNDICVGVEAAILPTD